MLRNRVSAGCWIVLCASVWGCAADGADVQEVIESGASASTAARGAPIVRPLKGTTKPKVDLQSFGASIVSADPIAGAAGHGIDGSIQYHGGKVMLGTTNVYYVWYGNWAGSTTPAILTDLAKSIGGSAYFNINTTYYGQNRGFVSNAVRLAGSTTDAYSQGKTLTDSMVFRVVKKALDEGRLPTDPDGVYFVFSSADVNADGFCNAYCAWHWVQSYGYKNIKFAFVPDHGACLGCCEDARVSPNGNLGADGMVDSVVHELEEAVTDPEIDAWYQNSDGAENADQCAWNYGKTYSAANGGKANTRLGSRDYLIQQNLVHMENDLGYCAQKLDPWGMTDAPPLRMQWTARSLPHATGRADAGGWSASVAQDSANYMQYGPYTTAIAAGPHLAVWQLAIDNNSADNSGIVRLEVSDASANQRLLASRILTRKEWMWTAQYQSFGVPFSIDAAQVGHQIELRVFWYKTAYVREYGVGVADTWPANGALFHQVGRADSDGWSANVAQDSAGYLSFGPYTTNLGAGVHTATFRMMVDNNTAANDGVASIDVYDAAAKTKLAAKVIMRRDWLSAGAYQDFLLPFTVPSPNTHRKLEFRVHWTDKAYVRLKSVGLAQ